MSARGRSNLALSRAAWGGRVWVGASASCLVPPPPEAPHPAPDSHLCQGVTWPALRALPFSHFPHTPPSPLLWAEWAEQLTKMGRGKHFIGDFLPPDELEKFMETFKALKEGREPDYSEYKEFKLTVENIGYQMLMKMGWKEGDGLGSEGQGIKNPVNKGTTTVDGAGFGIDRPAELSKEDDEYEAFRKRMMLAYRFRPNPLNNPRRPYY